MIKSITQKWGLELNLMFLVDPSYEGTEKSQAIESIAIAKMLPTSRPMPEDLLFELEMRKGLFNKKLDKFMMQLNEYREGALV